MEGFTKQTTFSISHDISYTQIDDEALILDAKNILYAANPVAAEIWQLLVEKPRSMNEIAHHIFRQYDVTEYQCLYNVKLFLSSLLEKKLIQAV